MNSWWRWRFMQWPMTLPSSRLSAANRVVVPWALVVVGHGAGPALLHGQARLAAVECLDLALLVDRKDHRLVRRIEVEADHVLDFLRERRVVGDLEAVHQMRLEAVRAPDILDAGVADADRARHRAHAPMGRVRRRLAHRLGQHQRLDGGAQRRRPRRPALVAQQAIDPGLQVTRLPAPHRRPLISRCAAMISMVAASRRRQKHDPRAPDHLPAACSGPRSAVPIAPDPRDTAICMLAFS